MDRKNEKCVMILDESLPLGLTANTAAIQHAFLFEIAQAA